MGLLTCALRPSGTTHGRPSCSIQSSSGDVVPMVPDLVKSQASVDNRLLGLPDPYLWHAIGTFNTCSWGPTHRSLTDTGRGYNLGGVGFVHHTP
jgi:hypothetical protein